ncbi:terpenoid synthase, partial [Imleria badia]
METSILSALTSFLIYFTLSGIPGRIIIRRKSVTNESLVRKESTLEKKVNKCGGPSRIFIAKMLLSWPWPRRVNPHYAVVKSEADTWMTSFQVFGPRAQDAYNRCDFNLLACMAHPSASKEHVRVVCDFMHLLFMFDEYSDRSTPSEVRKQKDVMMDAFSNPHTPRPKGEWIGGEVTRQFCERAIQHVTPTLQKRFIQYMDEYLEEVIQESIDNYDHLILDIKSYIDARRRNGAVKPTFCPIELGLGIPDAVMSHPIIQEMIVAAIDIITLSNDLLSYNLEQLRGDELHNIVTCVINEHNTDVNGAMLWVDDFLHGVEERFYGAM